MTTSFRPRIIAILLVFVFTVLPLSTLADVTTSRQYIEAQSADAWMTMALVALNSDSIALDHLRSVSGSTATDYAKTILALTAAGENPTTFGSVDYVAMLEGFLQNGQIGDPALLNDDMWGLLALSSVRKIDTAAAHAARTTILANQNNDGGWSYAVGGPSDSNDTAAALMALAETGMSVQDTAVSNALTYLRTTQNSDGGFGYQPNNASDSGSDAWVLIALRKLSVTSADWAVAQGTPEAHLQSLQDTDGGFWWVTPGTSDWNNKAMTPFAIMALSGDTIPLNYYHVQPNEDTNTPPPAGTFTVRIEGPLDTVCVASVAGPTALDVVKNAAGVCNFRYTITDTTYGPYLSEISGVTASGLSGWMYLVNNQSLAVGAAEYTMQQGDAVTWYYGQWEWQPTRVKLSASNFQSGDTAVITVESYDGTVWHLLPQARVLINNEAYTTNDSGTISLTVEGTYLHVVADASGYIRSAAVDASIDGSSNQITNLAVEIQQPGEVAGESIGIVVTPETISFGTLTPGATGTQSMLLKNIGSTPISLSASVSGDNIFSSLVVNGYPVHSFHESVAIDGQAGLILSLGVPSQYLDSGIKTGELTWWATPQ